MIQILNDMTKRLRVSSEFAATACARNSLALLGARIYAENKRAHRVKQTRRSCVMGVGTLRRVVLNGDVGIIYFTPHADEISDPLLFGGGRTAHCIFSSRFGTRRGLGPGCVSHLE